MDQRLQVTQAPREVAVPVPLQMPLLAVAWRILRADHARRAREKARVDAETAQTHGAFVAVADEVFRLKRLLANRTAAEDNGAATDVGAQLASLVERLEAALAGADVAVVAPDGQLYNGELLHLLENVGQLPNTAIDEPRIEEVLLPAVVHRGALLRMGKAVIGVPAQES